MVILIGIAAFASSVIRLRPVVGAGFRLHVVVIAGGLANW
jgi:hypothetical protein